MEDRKAAYLSELILTSCFELDDEAEERADGDEAELPPDLIAFSDAPSKGCENGEEGEVEGVAAESRSAEHLDSTSENEGEDNEHYRNRESYIPNSNEAADGLGKNTAHTKDIARTANSDDISKNVKEPCKDRRNYAHDKTYHPIGHKGNADLEKEGMDEGCAASEANTETNEEFLQAEKLLTAEYLKKGEGRKDCGKDPGKGNIGIYPTHNRTPEISYRAALGGEQAPNANDLRADPIKADRAVGKGFKEFHFTPLSRR